MNPAPAHRPPGPALTDRLVVKSNGHLLFLRLPSLHYVEAHGDYVRFHCDDHSALVRATLKQVASRLDPRRFLQIHRSTIVNVDRIARISFRDDRRLGVVLRNGTGLLVSDGCRQKVREFVERELDPEFPSHRSPAHARV